MTTPHGNTILISVVIPVYNREGLLFQAVKSAAEQSLSDSFEIIIVDDGSTDSTRVVCDGLLNDFPGRIHYMKQEHTGMPGQVRNRGAAAAGGRYLAFLDSDDLWQPEKLSKQLEYFDKNPEIRICHTREIWLRGEKEISQAGQRHTREGNIFHDALKKCIIGPSTVMMEKSLFMETGGFREDLEIAEDYEYWLRITPVFPVGYIDEPLVIKRAGNWEQLSERYGHIELFRLQGLQGLVDAGYFSGEHRQAAEAELAAKCRIYAAGCRKRGRLEEAEKYEQERLKYAENV